MTAHWSLFLEEEKQKPYYQNLQSFVDAAYQQQTVYPPKASIYKAFELTDLAKIKVVILGQDPYHGPNQANGLAFSVTDGITIPPSLKNIFKEVSEDTGAEIPVTGNLERWAEQGVFLLNDVLTVAQAKPGSHQKQGWETFTKNAIAYISENTAHTVFLLWGNYAQKKGKDIDASKHLILKSGHPSPMSANQGKWFGNKHFSKANAYLKLHHKPEIIW